jgi:dTDP-4-amino-4,6-dideoxygalactose transaminase
MESIEENKVIRLSKTCLSDAEKKAVIGVLDREFLGMGAEVQQFEKTLTEFFGRPAVCVSTGTAALHLALQAAGIGQGDEVLVQSLTYVASFQAISATGAKAVACDIDTETFCLDWRDAEKRLTPNTKAVMPVHYSGGVGALDEIYLFAKKYGLRVIEDAAHAFGTEYQNVRVGGFGDIACFSFDGIKNITSGEGGCIVTDDQEILKKVRDARLLGVEKDTEKRYSGERSWDFDVTEQGWRYHMSNIMAAIGIEQLKHFPVFSDKRRALAAQYDQLLIGTKGVRVINHDYGKVVPHIYVVEFNENTIRDQARRQLSEHGIQTGVHYQPNHWLSQYRVRDLDVRHVDEIYPRLLTLPLHPDLDEKDVTFICDILRKYLNET